jgi:polar amino acid transport system ATP-binding protein
MNIKLNDVTKVFNGNLVLDHLDNELEFKSLAILGPSGAGKSTLLRILGGLLEPDSGELYVNGNQVIYTEKDLLEYRRKIGFVFQNNGLFPHLSALDNITLPLIRVFGIEPEKAKEQAMGYLRRFGLENQANQSPVTLSGGQQQRIAIIRAVVNRPQMILLDEPTSALDPDLSVEVLEMLKELIHDGLNIVLVTHHLGFARNVCESMLFVDENKIVEFGSSKHHFANPETENLRRYIEKMNEF